MVTAHNQKGQTVEFSYKEKGARVMEASLYTTSGTPAPTACFRKSAKLSPGRKVAVTLPEKLLHQPD